MEAREPLVDISRSENNAAQTDNSDVVARLVNRIKELEQKVYGSHFLQSTWETMWEGSGLSPREEGILTKVSRFLSRFSKADLTRLLLYGDEDDDDEDHLGPLEVGAGAQARKVAAQAVIELTDKLTRAEQENNALRQRLHDSRRLSKVGQELEDVLAERDALKVVNTELAMKLTAPRASAGTVQAQEAPEAFQALEELERERASFRQTSQAKADQVAQMEAKIALLKSASAEEAAHCEGLQHHLSAAQQELASTHAQMQGVESQLVDAQAKECEQAAALDQLNVQLSSAQKELAASQAQVQRAEEKVADAQARETDQAAAKKDLEEQLSSVRTELAGSRAELHKAGEQLAEAQARESEKATAIEQMLRQKERLDGELAAAGVEAQRMEQELGRLRSQQESLTQQVRDARAAQAAASATIAKLERQYIEERNLRREVHEELQVLRGNIRVVCRARPAAPEEEPILAFPMAGALTVSPPDKRVSDFEFNACFGPESTQEEVFEEIAPLICSCVDGYNACIFAYGQTGSGKTHTMHGPPEDPGVYQRALQELFAATGSASADADADAGAVVVGGGHISVAMMEIYNDDARDLLADTLTGKAASLDVSALGAGQLPPGVERVPGLTWRQVANVDDVAAVLADGSRQRSTAATAMNSSSSRSHAILSVKICADPTTGACSLLHLVDLAGSERVGKSEVTGAQLKEAQSINKSLSALGDVISALQRRASHIPFRNSKLTQALQDSLCGSSKVMLVCNLSPEAASASETLSSLNFAQRAAQVELGLAKRAAEVELPGLSKSGNASTPGSRRKSRSGLPSPTQKPASGVKKGADSKGKAGVTMDFAGRFVAP